jgi:hypothetical protein
MSASIIMRGYDRTKIKEKMDCRGVKYWKVRSRRNTICATVIACIGLMPSLMYLRIRDSSVQFEMMIHLLQISDEGNLIKSIEQTNSKLDFLICLCETRRWEEE